MHDLSHTRAYRPPSTVSVCEPMRCRTGISSIMLACNKNQMGKIYKTRWAFDNTFCCSQRRRPSHEGPWIAHILLGLAPYRPRQAIPKPQHPKSADNQYSAAKPKTALATKSVGGLSGRFISRLLRVQVVAIGGRSRLTSVSPLLIHLSPVILGQTRGKSPAHHKPPAKR